MTLIRKWCTHFFHLNAKEIFKKWNKDWFLLSIRTFQQFFPARLINVIVLFKKIVLRFSTG